MTTREDITTELLRGVEPAQLTKKYPRKSVYRIYSELLQDGKIPGEAEVIHAEDMEVGDGSGINPFIPATPAIQTQAREKLLRDETGGKTGAEFIDVGQISLPIDAVNRIRGILGISVRPKVLSMPTPELLYPAMIISITELGFEPMRPDDFIDTVLYQWLEACDIIPYAFIKKSELEEIAKRYNEEQVRKTTTQDIKEPLGESISEEIAEMEEETSGVTEDVPETLEKMADSMEPGLDEEKGQELTKQEIEAKVETITEPQPHKTTVGDLLQRLRIENIQMEVENDSSTNRTKPISS